MKTKPMRPAVPMTVILTLTVGLLVQARGQPLPDLPFNSGSTGADGSLTFSATRSFSPGRRGLGMAYDALHRQIVLFSGYNGSARNDTWLWDGATWTLSPSGFPGPGTSDVSMVYDAARQQTLIFGGADWATSYWDDTYAWDGTSWIRKATAGPAPRVGHAMAYDAARGQTVLFGGYAQLGPYSYVADTWVWNGTNWSQRSPASSPSARSVHAMAYDAARSQVILFGGANGTMVFGDTWSWNGTNWTELSPANSPSARNGHAMAYDESRQGIVLFGGSDSSRLLDDTVIWNGTNWVQTAYSTKPAPRYGHAMAFDAARQVVVVAGGVADSRGLDRRVDRLLDDTWSWNGTNWSFRGGKLQQFDMTARSNGMFHFTTIDVPVGVTVFFKKNAANSPLRWLATSNVTVNGTLDLGGQYGDVRRPNAQAASAGGPGGFAGGFGGIPFNQNGSYAGTAGVGPGGGAAGVTNNQSGVAGRYASVYGSPYVQPLIGGSGGGGSGSTTNGYGYNGGGGGGAALISSSRDMVVNGSILAKGGVGGVGAGSGSGGAIRLQADRITVTGTLDTLPDGRVRLESYYRNVMGSVAPSPSIAGPTPTQPFDTPTSQLLITSVAGQNVVQPPGADPLSPDVTFTSAGDITVTVSAQSIPDGTPVTLRVTTQNGVINRPAGAEPNVLLAGGIATFTLTVPQGSGTVQAFAQFNLTRP